MLFKVFTHVIKHFQKDNMAVKNATTLVALPTPETQTSIYIPAVG